jgi:hypothetical protein
VVGSRERYDPATASGTNRSAARIAYFIKIIVWHDAEKSVS